MKKLYRSLLFLCLPLALASCEEGVFEPQPSPTCLEVRQQDGAGQALEKNYDGKKLVKYAYLRNDTLRYYYDFTYDSNGRITKSQYVNALNPSASHIPEIISYDEEGRWAASTFTFSAGEVVTRSIEYDDQDQIQKITTSTTNSGATTVNSTAVYTWEGGNNTKVTYASPTREQVILYEFDLSQENKRQEELEKLAFLSAGSIELAHNKNMLRRKVYTTTAAGSAPTESESEYYYEYDEEGYPYRVTRTSTNSSGTFTNVTDFTYDCD